MGSSGPRRNRVAERVGSRTSGTWVSYLGCYGSYGSAIHCVRESLSGRMDCVSSRLFRSGRHQPMDSPQSSHQSSENKGQINTKKELLYRKKHRLTFQQYLKSILLLQFFIRSLALLLP